MKAGNSSSPDLADVRRVFAGQLRGTPLDAVSGDLIDTFATGKMLRARLVLGVGQVADAQPDYLISSAVAVEMVHAASLLHEDAWKFPAINRDA